MNAVSIKHVIVTGRVQGVGYRAWLADEAATRKLAGWVRNRRDGSVEAVFEGPEPVVMDMIAACRRGPALARVENVVESDADEETLKLSRSGFTTLPTL